MHRTRPLLALLTLALLGSAHALDAAGLAPALETAFPPSVAYLDCPFQHAARTCVLVPNADSVRAGDHVVLDALRAKSSLQAVTRNGADGGYRFQVGATSYRLRVAPSRARPGMFAATLSFSFDQAGATHAVCLRPNALFAFARLPSLTPEQVAQMATAVTCHGADPVDAQGRTPLWDAVASRDLAAVRTLLRGGADPNHIGDDGSTPLLEAARSGTRPILDALLQAGGDPTYIAPDGSTVASLEPFNRRLANPADTPTGDAILARLPDPLNGAPTSNGAATAGQPRGGATPPPAGSRRPATGPRPVAATTTSTSPRPTPAASAARRAAPPAASGGRARARLPWLPAGIVLAALAAVLAVTRWRAGRRAAPEPAPRSDGAAWQPLPQPKPLSRRRRARRLDPANPWSEPLG